MLLEGRPLGDVLLVDAHSGELIRAKHAVRAAQAMARLDPPLLLLQPDRSAAAAVWLLAALESGTPVVLADPGLQPRWRDDLLDRYQPELVAQPESDRAGSIPPGYLAIEAPAGLPGMAVWMRAGRGQPTHPELSVLLTTSGSTGSPKLVRLSRANIRANAEQIVASLGLQPVDRAIATLPLHYSFGMSVLTSHLLAGSSVVLSQLSVMEPAFWEQVDQAGVSHMPGVPYTYRLLHRIGFGTRIPAPTLRMLTQAGGRLDPALVRHFHELMAARGGQFRVMYGQTEASPRIACMPAGALPAKLGSAGVALPGGVLSVRDESGSALPPGAVGAVHYRGPNVMLGYAETREDLQLGQTGPGELDTGDLGYLDAEGFLFLTGRSRRIAKLAGARVSLDELEARATEVLGLPTAAVDAGDRGVIIWVEGDPDHAGVAAARRISATMAIPAALLRVQAVASLPTLASGKTDYAALQRAAVTATG